MRKIVNADCIKYLTKNKFKVDLVITDPPYFVLPKGKNGDKFTWDNFNSLDEFIEFTNSWFSLVKKKCKKDTFIFIFWSQKYFKLGLEIFNPSRVLFWHYSNLVMGGGGDFAYDYEPIFVVKVGNPKLIKGKHSCIFNYTKPQSNFKVDTLYHPTQKPLELIKKLISLTKAKTVLDPFMGSGTTCVAAKIQNVNWLGIDKNKKYFKIAKKRLKKVKK